MQGQIAAGRGGGGLASILRNQLRERPLASHVLIVSKALRSGGFPCIRPGRKYA